MRARSTVPFSALSPFPLLSSRFSTSRQASSTPAVSPTGSDPDCNGSMPPGAAPNTALYSKIPTLSLSNSAIDDTPGSGVSVKNEGRGTNGTEPSNVAKCEAEVLWPTPPRTQDFVAWAESGKRYVHDVASGSRPIRAVISDLDGTLLCPDRNVSARTLDAVRKVRCERVSILSSSFHPGPSHVEVPKNLRVHLITTWEMGSFSHNSGIMWFLYTRGSRMSRPEEIRSPVALG